MAVQLPARILLLLFALAAARARAANLGTLTDGYPERGGDGNGPPGTPSPFARGRSVPMPAGDKD